MNLNTTHHHSSPNRSITTTVTVTAARARSVDDLGAAPPDSWEVADLDATMSRLMLNSKRDNTNNNNSNNNNNNNNSDLTTTSSSSEFVSDSSVPVRSSSGGVLEDLIDSVDQFLREALQNPRERLSAIGYLGLRFNTSAVFVGDISSSMLVHCKSCQIQMTQNSDVLREILTPK